MVGEPKLQQSITTDAAHLRQKITEKYEPGGPDQNIDSLFRSLIHFEKIFKFGYFSIECRKTSHHHIGQSEQRQI